MRTEPTIEGAFITLGLILVILIISEITAHFRSEKRIERERRRHVEADEAEQREG